MRERDATEEEVEDTVKQGEQFHAKFNRIVFLRNFLFNREWRGKYYRTKQIETYAIKEGNDWLVIAVVTRYF